MRAQPCMRAVLDSRGSGGAPCLVCGGVATSLVMRHVVGLHTKGKARSAEQAHRHVHWAVAPCADPTGPELSMYVCTCTCKRAGQVVGGGDLSTAVARAWTRGCHHQRPAAPSIKKPANTHHPTSINCEAPRAPHSPKPQPGLPPQQHMQLCSQRAGQRAPGRDGDAASGRASAMHAQIQNAVGIGIRPHKHTSPAPTPE